MQLSKKNIQNITSQSGVVIPAEDLLALPEKVLQFGTGVLLRGLPDYFIDKANRQGVFNGRIVIVKSTASGGADTFAEQDNLYTLCVRGIEDGEKVDEAIINSSVSRVLSASSEWKAILKCAHNPELKIIISNTTEVGISLVKEDVRGSVPASFPGKLLAFLLERFNAFKGSIDAGTVIIPTELITDNGTKLKSIVIELAGHNNLDKEFIEWIEQANFFCNSLVDRIVPGKLPLADREATQQKLGYQDDLMIMAECYRLWAIEYHDEKVKEILSFHKVDEGIVLAKDIDKFRELKLRVLNGSHTFSCGLAYLAGFRIVRDTMDDESMSAFIRHIMLKEIGPAIVSQTLSYDDAKQFAEKVLDRFRNPFLEHQWISITVQYSSKMKMRNVPLLIKHYGKTNMVPVHMALGFAAYLLFMKSEKNAEGKFEGQANGEKYIIQDDHAGYFLEKWKNGDVNTFVDSVLNDKQFWGADLSVFPGFGDAVKRNLFALIETGAAETIKKFESN